MKRPKRTQCNDKGLTLVSSTTSYTNTSNLSDDTRAIYAVHTATGVGQSAQFTVKHKDGTTETITFPTMGGGGWPPIHIPLSIDSITAASASSPGSITILGLK